MSSQPPSINLVVQSGPNPGQAFTVQKRSQTIGWSSSNDIPIAEPSLSRQHARIRARPDGFVIEDLGSTSGTFVNGQQVTGPTWLRPGDILQLGNVVLSVQSSQLEPGYQEAVRPDSTFVPSTPTTARPGLTQYAAPPLTPVQYPPTRERSPWIWVVVIMVAILIVGAVLGGLYYYSTVLSVPPTQVPTEIAQRATAVQVQQVQVEPTPTSTPTLTPAPTATPLPTPEPVEIAVPGVSALAAEEGEPSGDVKQIGPGQSQIEARADEPVVIGWGWIAAEDSETDYLAQWLEVAHYDVRLDNVPITELGLLNYYRTQACGDNGECGPALNWWVNLGLLPVGAHRVTFESYTSRAVSSGFDVNPADGELDVYGPGRVDTRSCDIIVMGAVVEDATLAPPPMPTSIVMPMPTPIVVPTPTSTIVPTTPPSEVIASPLGVFQDFESESTWKRGDQPYGQFNRSTAQVHSGGYAGQLTYNFPTVDNEFVVFLQTRLLAGRPNAISAWVYGDNSGHYFNVWIKDAAGEVWQSPLGQIEHTGWQRMTAWLDPGREWPHTHISGPSNNAIDYPINFYALVLDDIPDTFSGGGTIYVDDLTSQEGAPPPPTTIPTTVAPQSQPKGYTVEISVSPNIIKVGECAALVWHIENVQSAHVNGEGVVGPYGSKQVCPNSTTTYVLTVNLHGGGSDSRSATVTVNQ